MIWLFVARLSDVTVSSVHTSDLSSFEESAMSSANVSSDEEEATPSVEKAEAEVEKPEVKEGMCVLGVITNKIEPWFEKKQ